VIPAIVVRPGQETDLEAVSAIQAESPEAAQWEPRLYLEYELRVAAYGPQVAGFVVLRTLAPGESEILNLATAREFRRRGVARALVGSCLRDFAGSVFLEVRASNQGAQKFYKSLGFQEVTVRPEYYSSPAESGIVMKFHSC
jgi:ribosomal-protein-alanine N-acetyltransferase